MRKTVRWFNYLMLTTLFAGCSKDYDIQLPPGKRELVIECYLEHGEPLRALITESADLLDTSQALPASVPALVIITYRNVKDTLLPSAYVDTLRRRTYNYGSPKKVMADYHSNDPYRIDVYDNAGRHAYGETRFMPLVPIDSLTLAFNNVQEAFCLTKFKDPNPDLSNYFRLLLHKNAVYDSLSLEVLLDNNFANDNNEYLYGSGYDFRKGDIIYGTLYHLSFEYYQYLTTVQNARTALVNPFAVSGEVVSNIKGGLGVFAALSFTRKSVVVR